MSARHATVHQQVPQAILRTKFAVVFLSYLIVRSSPRGDFSQPGKGFQNARGCVGGRRQNSLEMQFKAGSVMSDCEPACSLNFFRLRRSQNDDLLSENRRTAKVVLVQDTVKARCCEEESCSCQGPKSAWVGQKFPQKTRTHTLSQDKLLLRSIKGPRPRPRWPLAFAQMRLWGEPEPGSFFFFHFPRLYLQVLLHNSSLDNTVLLSGKNDGAGSKRFSRYINTPLFCPHWENVRRAVRRFPLCSSENVRMSFKKVSVVSSSKKRI